MELKRPRVTNIKLDNSRRSIEYECLMADLNLLGVVGDVQYGKYTRHEKSSLIKEPESPSTGGGGTGTIPLVPDTTADVSVDLNAIDEQVITAAIAGKETWQIHISVNVYNGEKATKNLQKLINLLAAHKQTGNKVQIELRATVISAQISIPASCFTPLKDVLTDIQLVPTNAIKEIGAAAFEGCTQLSAPLTVDAEFIGQRAFAGCTNLSDVRFRGAVRSIGKGVFKDCESLTNVMFDHRDYIIDGTLVDMGASSLDNAANFKTAWVDKDITRKN